MEVELLNLYIELELWGSAAAAAWMMLQYNSPELTDYVYDKLMENEELEIALRNHIRDLIK